MVMVCGSQAAAGQVMMRLIGEGLYPHAHFRVEQTGPNHFPISITITSMLSATQTARLHAGIATIPGASIQ
jgi:hypothetical protein